MTDHPKPTAAALAAADAICKKHGMLPGGYMRDSLAEALEAFAAEAVEESWLPRCGETGKRSVNGVCPEHGGNGCLMASAIVEAKQGEQQGERERIIALIWDWRDRFGGFEAQQFIAALRDRPGEGTKETT